MNRIAIFALTTALLAATGCQDGWLPHDDHNKANALLVRSPSDEAIRNAIIRQRTLFEYHFVPDSPALNELGLSDLAVLIDHFSKHPGHLNLRRGNQSNELYEARMARIMERLAHAKVEVKKVSIGDAPAGGDGKPSREVIEILSPKGTSTSAMFPMMGSTDISDYASGDK